MKFVKQQIMDNIYNSIRATIYSSPYNEITGEIWPSIVGDWFYLDIIEKIYDEIGLSTRSTSQSRE